MPLIPTFPNLLTTAVLEQRDGRSDARNSFSFTRDQLVALFTFDES